MKKFEGQFKEVLRKFSPSQLKMFRDLVIEEMKVSSQIPAWRLEVLMKKAIIGGVK
jgi:hypothetical protein